MFLSFFACSLLLLPAVVLGKMLSFDQKLEQLHFQCPEEGSVNGDALSVSLKQDDGNGGKITLASWSYGKAAQSKSNRVKVSDAQSPFKLDVTLHGVTSFDAVLYECAIAAQNDDRGTFHVKNSEVFYFDGQVTEPVITYQPMKECYNVGDVLDLNCTAHIGKAENKMIWEFKRLPRDEFHAIQPYDETEHEEGTRCQLPSRSSLKYTLTEGDNGLQFRCRLQESGNETSWTVEDLQPANVACAASKPSAATGIPGIPTPDTVGARAAALTQDHGPRYGQSLFQTSEEERREREREESSNGFGITAILLYTIIPLSVAVVLVAMAILLRQWRKKGTLPPVVIVDTPTSSQSGYSSYIDRPLPITPFTPQQQRSNDDFAAADMTVPKWRMSSLTLHEEDSGHVTDMNQSVSTSVYMTMGSEGTGTGMVGVRGGGGGYGEEGGEGGPKTYLLPQEGFPGQGLNFPQGGSGQGGRVGKGGWGCGEGGEVGVGAARGGGGGGGEVPLVLSDSEDLEPYMRAGRSESVYSNDQAIANEARRARKFSSASCRLPLGASARSTALNETQGLV